MSDELSRMDATAMAELVSSGEASPLELVDAAIDRVEQVNGELNAVIHPLFDEAREAASGELPDGPFKGVPFLLKDLGAAFAGQPLHLGMRVLKEANFTAPMDTYLAQRFRDAGLITIGKTNTPELGILPTTEPVAYGATSNPWDTSRSPGGSSGGSGAAVAGGMVPMAHANDGGGSIRIPASNNGLVGLKPTRQRISEGPLIGDNVSGLTVELAVSRSVRDTARLLDAVQGPAPGDPYVAPEPIRPYVDELDDEQAGLRVGIMTAPAVESEVDPDCVAAVEDAAKLLESLGHHLTGGSLIDVFGGTETDAGMQIQDSFLTRWAAGQAATLAQVGMLLGRELTGDDVEPLTWALARDRARAGQRPLPAGRLPAPGDQPDDRRLVRGRPRPAADPDDGRGRAEAGGDQRHADRQPDGRLPSQLPLGRVHGAVQRHRTAGDLAAAALDRRGGAGRRPAGRAVRPRGPADPGCRAARAGAALGGSGAAGVRRLIEVAASGNRFGGRVRAWPAVRLAG